MIRKKISIIIEAWNFCFDNENVKQLWAANCFSLQASFKISTCYSKRKCKLIHIKRKNKCSRIATTLSWPFVLKESFKVIAIGHSALFIRNLIEFTTVISCNIDAKCGLASSEILISCPQTYYAIFVCYET